MDSLAKIIVKVGKQSNVKLSHCKALRAIVAEDLERLTNKYTDCNIVIIEDISEDESETVKKFILDFVAKNENNSVLFLIANENDRVTSGLADELDYNIYFTLKEVCEFIKSKYGLNVGATLEDRKIEDDTSDIFDTFNSEDNGTIESDIQNEIEQVVDDSDIFENVKQSRQEEIEREGQYEEKSTDLEDIFDSTFIQKETTKVQEQTVETKPVKEDKPIKEEKPVKEETVANNKEQNTNSSEELEEYKAFAKEEIEKLQTKLRDANYEYNILLKDVKGANARIVQLEELVEAIKVEKQEIENRFNELLEDETVIEDPITLSEYTELKEQLNKKDSAIEKLEQTVNTLKEQADEAKTSSELKDIEINNLNSTVLELQDAVTSDKINQERISQLTEDVQRYKDSAEQLRVEKDKLSDKVTELGELNQEIQNGSDVFKHKLSLEVDYRKESISLIQLAFKKVAEVSKSLEESNKKLTKLQRDIDKSNSTADELRKQNDILNEDTTKLKSELKKKDDAIDKLETAMKTSDSFLDEKLGELNRVTKQKEELEQSSEEQQKTIGELKTQITVLEAQLKQKEDQYDLIVTQNQSEKSSGDNAVNKQLEQTNKSLMEQLSVVKRELDSSKKSCQALKIELETAQLSSETTYSNTGGTPVVEEVAPIRYTGKANIITVFSSGSVGATTLAMSIVSRMAPTAKVLYMDFDMVTPNADAWFSRTPFCQGIPNVNRDNKASALGIFYEKGVGVFTNYVDKLISNIENTKGGCIDYLSGVYYRVARQKVYDADYTELFNTIGSMYEYIIVDLGRLGNSDVNDAVIREITNIAYRNIVVTTPDKFEVRQFDWKLKANNIDKSKIVWLFNMCTSSQIDPYIQKLTSGFKAGQIFEDQALRGTREKFTRDRQNRDRLDAFINSALFYR